MIWKAKLFFYNKNIYKKMSFKNPKNLTLKGLSISESCIEIKI